MSNDGILAFIMSLRIKVFGIKERYMYDMEGIKEKSCNSEFELDTIMNLWDILYLITYFLIPKMSRNMTNLVAVNICSAQIVTFKYHFLL